MATNFNSTQVPIYGVALKKRFRSLLVPLTSLNLIGLAATTTKVILNFDRPPLRLGLSALLVNWAITGGTPITVTAVTTVGSTIELDVTGTFDGGPYFVSIPSGLGADSGIDGFPFPYAGPITVQFALGSLGPPATPPVISGLTPTPASNIYPSTPLQFDATDPDGMVLITAYVSYPDGSTEQVYDGTTFTSKYSTSTITPILDGSRLSLVRTGGWPASPTLYPVAVDSFGARSVAVNYAWTRLPEPTSPEVIQVVSPKYTQVRVTYSKPVVMTTAANGALRVANYTIPGLTIVAAAQINSQQVLLSTSAQTADLVYYLTITGVQDLEGNTIV